MNVLLTVLLASVLVAASSGNPSEWSDYKVRFNKNYSSSQEDEMHRILYDKRLLEIEAHNRNYEAGLVTYRKGINQFTDMTEEERSSYTTLRVVAHLGPYSSNQTTFQSDPSVKIPVEVNWIEKGAVNPIQNQGYCGSCYAFSSVAALESHYFIKTGQLLKASEQQVVDCSKGYMNGGCKGGIVAMVFMYIHDRGIQSATSYPYRAFEGQCRANSSASIMRVRDFIVVEPNREDLMAEAVAIKGPLVVGICGGKLLDYVNGIMHAGPECNRMDHGVTIVGYGSENGTDYWLVRNSWGDRWGEQGYFRIVRGKDSCLISQIVMYPEV